MSSRAFTGGAAGAADRTRAAVGGMWSARRGGHGEALPRPGRRDGEHRRRRDHRRPPELGPFRAAIDAGVPLVMLSHALYPALDPNRIASQSPRVATGLLRRRARLRRRGRSRTASRPRRCSSAPGVATAAERSVRAGADLILMTGSRQLERGLPAAARPGPPLAAVPRARATLRRASARAEAALGAAPAVRGSGGVSPRLPQAGRCSAGVRGREPPAAASRPTAPRGSGGASPRLPSHRVDRGPLQGALHQLAVRAAVAAAPALP